MRVFNCNDFIGGVLIKYWKNIIDDEKKNVGNFNKSVLQYLRP